MESLPAQFEIGDLRVDLGQQRVRRNGADVPLPKLSFDLLLVLARAAPNLVSPDELMTQVWANLVVSPETVSQRVKLLRDALGDDPRDPRYVLGLRGRGYRLLAPVVPVAEVPHPPPATASAVPSPTPAIPSVSMPLPTSAPQSTFNFAPATRSSRRFLLTGTGILFLAGAIVLGWKLAHVENRAVAEVTVTGLPAHTVAVLPFDDLSLARDNGQLALGLSEMVLQRLGSVKELLVIARSSSFAFNGQQVDAREIGRRLAARYLVEGSVQHIQDRLRVTTQLVDAESGQQLRALSFDRRITDIFDLQDDIAGQVAAALEVQLAGADLKRVDRTRSTSLDAYLGYMRAQSLLNRWTVADVERAVGELERAIAIDPGFALGYAELARAKSLAHWLRTSNTQGKEELMSFIDKALALDPRLGEAYAIRGSLRAEVDPKAAELDFRKGIELAPNYGPGYEMYAEALHDNLGRPAEAMAMIERAMLIDPIAPRGFYIKGLYLFLDHNSIDQAAQWMLKALEVGPEFPPALARLGQFKWSKGDIAAGIKLLERAIQIDPEPLWLQSVASAMYLDIGDRRAAGTFARGQLDVAGVGIMLSTFDRDFSKDSTENKDWVADESFVSSHVSAMAFAAKDPQRAERAIASLRKSLSIKEGRESVDFTDGAHIGDIIELGFLLKLRGHRDAAAGLAATLLRWADRNEKLGGIFHGVAHQLAGERDAALESLAAEMRQGHLSAWWIIERNPVWDGVRDDPRYEAIMSDLRQHSAAQRSLLENMRRSGEVPPRG